MLNEPETELSKPTVGRPVRREGEHSNIRVMIYLSPSEFIHFRDYAELKGESMSEFARRSIARRVYAETGLKLGRPY